MSNFTFGHIVFKSRLLLLRQNASAAGKWLRAFIRRQRLYKLVLTVYLSFPSYRRIRMLLQQTTF